MVANLRIHQAKTEFGQGWPTYADYAGADATAKIVVGTSASAAIDVSTANVVRVQNRGDGSGEGELCLVTGDSEVGDPDMNNFYAIPAGQIAYIAVDRDEGYIKFIGENASMVVRYSLIG